MGFASSWIEERAFFPELIHEAADSNTGIICVVPAYNEPGITKMLDSLAECNEPKCKTELIIVINAPYKESGEHVECNKVTLNNIESWKKGHKNPFFRLYYFVADNRNFAGWGVGLARKTGMDEALRRFSYIGNREGVILCLDADCIVQKNYFESVFNELYSASDRSACSLYFEHPVSGPDYPDYIYRYITLYELHLRYYYQALLFTGYPWVFHTVGSSMAVKALPYMKAGGMNRKQAGEDFYFIQKHVSSGGFFSLNSTTVYPSPRVSDRVPFGTGASIGKLDETDSSDLLTYNLLSFKELRAFFDLADAYYECIDSDLKTYYDGFPHGIKSFMGEKEWVEKISEIKNNTSTIHSFRKRFFQWFNMFRIVKYLNHVHSVIYDKLPVTDSASDLLSTIGITVSSDEAASLLISYRKLEKNNAV